MKRLQRQDLNTITINTKRIPVSTLPLGSRGLALITILWIIVLLTAIVTEFAHSMKTEIYITKNQKEDMEAYFLAKGGINMAIAEIVEDYQYVYNNNNILVFGDKGTALREGKLSTGTFSYTIRDEESKLNINSASRDQLFRLFSSINIISLNQKMPIENKDKDIEERINNIVDSIIDWRDNDDIPGIQGAEDDYYKSLTPPYGSKDNRFDTLEELLLVKGMTPDAFFKTPTSTDSNLYDYITPFPSGINYNTALEVVLKAIYYESGMAEQIINKRLENSGIFSTSHTSRIFTIISNGKNINGSIERRIKAVVKKYYIENNIPKINILYWNDNFI